MLTLILADSELELVPDAIKGHPAVVASAKRRGQRPGRALLDSSQHHAAMRGLGDAERRGRPDIVHLFLLTALDSVLNLEGGLRVLVHTRNDEVITLAPETRIMRAYDRFTGLMEQVLRDGSAGPKDQPPLLTLERNVPLGEAVKRCGAERVVALDTGARAVGLTEELSALAQAHGHVAIILGGFPKGAFRSPVAGIANEVWSIHPQALSVWIAASEVLVRWAEVTKGTPQHRGAVK